MVDIESRRETFKKRFRRSGSLGIPFVPEEEVPNLKDYFSYGNDGWVDDGELLSLIIPLSKKQGTVFQILETIEKQGLEVHHFESRAGKTDCNKLDILVQLKIKPVTNREEILNKMEQNGLQVEESEQHSSLRLKPAKMDSVLDDDEEGIKELLASTPWFPRTINDMDIAAKRVLMYGSELDADHPGFKDKVYRERRMKFAETALNYKHGEPIPRIEYTEAENTTWKTIYRELRALHIRYACKEYLDNFHLLELYCGYSEERVPQLEDVSKFLKSKTGFQLRPVAGYLSSRDFLAALAFRVFCCTQYIRHPKDPFYSPEPDCCHELMGHMALFADADFAQFSQEIGLASLGASEDEISKLATLYFFTIEFGLCRQKNEMKVYGAGLLSSIGELKHVAEGTPTVHKFDPDLVVKQECLITTFQAAYFYTDDFEEMQQKIRMFASNMRKPFVLRYNPYTESIEILSHKRTMLLAVNSLRSDVNLLAQALHQTQVKK